MPDNSKSTRDFVEQIRQASPEELHERLRHIQEALFNLRFRLASGQVEDPKRVRKYRKAIARIRTIQTERGLS
ncbi:50S ribosomal protein L29 [bacterium]|nr:50S ribosomal protein L29 [bacterium]